MIDQLKSVGIEQGKPFSPSEDVRARLSRAAVEAREFLDVKYEALFPIIKEASGRCLLPTMLSTAWRTPSESPVYTPSMIVARFSRSLSPVSRNWDQASSVWWPFVTTACETRKGRDRFRQSGGTLSFDHRHFNLVRQYR